jgi:tryptophanase
MFANLAYLQLDDGVSNDEDCNQDSIDKVGIVNIGGLIAMDEDSYFDNVNMPKGSSAPMYQALAYLHETMAEITTKCTTSASIELCDHATSFF